jgi:hypothetical protein
MNLTSARKKTEKIRVGLDDGMNPIVRKQQPEPTSTPVDTVGALIDDWLDDHKAHKKGPRSKELISAETLALRSFASRNS